ncbi:hypothetical protein DL767_002834 [Monosporascus sp. MG133]|nr:hypothetical protein DL767_002834 [Monosporascus sp. MG133]
MLSMNKIIAAVGLVVAPALAYSGDLTWYNPGLGACGRTHNDGSAVVALARSEYGNDPNPNLAAVCGRWIAINYNGRVIHAEVADKCWDCQPGDIDVSPSLFSQLADLGVGRIQVTWDFI